ncbi:MAG: hypothetical protein EOP04_26055, partial [Proteobacteria bacterium]
MSKMSERDDKVGKIIELDEELEKDFMGRTNTAFSATGQMFDQMMRIKKKKDPSYFYQAQEGEEKGEFDLLEEQMTKVSKDLRGKQFVLDRYGQPVVLGKVNADSLPPFTVSPSSSVVEATADKSKPSSPRNAAPPKSKVLRVALLEKYCAPPLTALAAEAFSALRLLKPCAPPLMALAAEAFKLLVSKNHTS